MPAAIVQYEYIILIYNACVNMVFTFIYVEIHPFTALT